MSRRALTVPALAVCLGLGAACSDNTGPKQLAATPPLDTLPGLIVSQPVGGAGAAAVGAVRVQRIVAGSSSVAYVSLVPGTVPTGLLATIRDRANGQSVTAAVVDGGFDPVAIPTSVGDTLAVDITRSGTAGVLHATELVRAHHPPVVIRTSPPAGGRDVPLNACVVVVFSDPIAPPTLTPKSVQLWRDTVLMAGTVRVADSVGIRVEFHPDSVLAGQTTYQLVVTPAVEDVAGLALDSAVTVPFTTGTMPPPTGLEFTSVSAGEGHTCGVTKTGAAYCWGSNYYGQLGNGATTDEATPVAVAGGLTFRTVSAGEELTCGITTAGAAYCWGSNFYGELGNGTIADQPTPVAVAGGLTFLTLSATGGDGGGDFVCGVTTSNTAYCWGFELPAYYASVPDPVNGAPPFWVLSAGIDHVCGVAVGGAGYCWGSDQFGQLGSGDTTGTVQHTPVPVAGGLVFTVVSARAQNSCGLTAAGTTYCWGWLPFGGPTTGLEECSSGDAMVPSSECYPFPVAISGAPSFVTLSLGENFFCGVTAAGLAYCWGANGSGGLGDGTTTDRATPVAVAGGLTFASVSAGGGHTCGVTTTGAVYCWGSNASGQLGDGTTTSSSVPVKVAGQL